MSTRPLVLIIGDVENKGFSLKDLGKFVQLGEIVGDRLAQEEDYTKEESFENPSQINPSRTSKFCSYLNLDREAELVEQNYKAPKEHFHFPIDSMIRLIPFQRLSQIKYHTTLASRLKDECAKDLGFKSKSSEYLVPDRRTIGLFMNKRLGNNELKEIQQSLTNRLKKELHKHGIKLGKRITLDSTPLETLRKDPIGRINKHYFQKYGIGNMVKVHFATCVDTNVPLETLVVGGNSYDGHFLTAMLLTLKRMGIDFEEVYGDAHYGPLRNWAEVSVLFRADCYFQLAKNTIWREDGTEEKIERRYWRLRKKHIEDNWWFRDQGELSFEGMCEYLIANDEYEPVGAYYRNKWWKIKQKNSREYEMIYHRRNISEGLNGILKDQLLMNKNLNVKGFDAIEFYVRQFLVTLLFVALTRVKNGTIQGLTKINPTAFI